MQCPHCLVEYHPQTGERFIDDDTDGRWVAIFCTCPKCKRITVTLQCRGPVPQTRMAWPKGAARSPLPEEVSARYSEDYLEACKVLADSPKASAALSRRCLQDILRDIAGVKPGDLHDEIQQVLDSGKLPSGTADAIDAVRSVGNFAVHPSKSKQTGIVVAVEPGEAELLLEVLEELFDFYFVRPAHLKARIEPINKKLQALGKPPIELRS